MTDTKAIQEGVAAHSAIVDADFAEIEKRFLAHSIMHKPKRRHPLIVWRNRMLARYFPGLDMSMYWRKPFRLSFTSTIEPSDETYPDVGVNILVIGPFQAQWYKYPKRPKLIGGYVGPGPGPKWYLKEGEFVFPNHARNPFPDVKPDDGTFLQFKHGEPGPTGARKSQIDVYKQAAARLVDGNEKFEGDPRAALYAQYGEGPKED